MMSSSPLPIRRAGQNELKLAATARDHLIASPAGHHLYGSTPGGSRIVYSREQLLSLASSPLSKTPPHIPAEISRSPEKTSALSNNGNAGESRKVESNDSHVEERSAGSLGMGQMANGSQTAATASQVFGSSSSSIQNGKGGNPMPRSPPAHTASRSPGNAFNFRNGPVSPNSGMTQSASFKERMAAAQSQSARQGSDGTLPSSSNGHVNGRGNAAHGEEQFDMEM